MIPCRLLIDQPAPGAWNMAVDEALLISASESTGCNLRFYRWSEPTISLGYFQAHALRQQHSASRHCPMVRRSSGGGALVHDDELTYSLTVSTRHSLGADARKLTHLVHGALIEALGQWDVSARLHEWPSRLTRRHEPFLCFQRRQVGDVLLGQKKVAGSAQRRRRGAVLQHGSVLLGTSAAAPELEGIAPLVGIPLGAEQLIAAWTPALVARLGLRCRTEVISAQEVEGARQIAEQKYQQNDWTLRR